MPEQDISLKKYYLYQLSSWVREIPHIGRLYVPTILGGLICSGNREIVYLWVFGGYQIWVIIFVDNVFCSKVLHR